GRLLQHRRRRRSRPRRHARLPAPAPLLPAELLEEPDAVSLSLRPAAAGQPGRRDARLGGAPAAARLGPRARAAAQPGEGAAQPGRASARAAGAAAARRRAAVGRLHRRRAGPRARARRGPRPARVRARHRLQRPWLRDGAHRRPPRLRADRGRQALARPRCLSLLALRGGRHRPSEERPVRARTAGYAIALDVGGTFTDVALVDEASGRLWVTKTPTTPDDPSTGFIAGVDKALRLAGVAPEALRHVLHGTTTATNAILENKGALSGLLTTAGFRDVLEIGRHDIPRRANMFAWVKPLRPVPPERIFEIGGRVTVEGAEIEPLDEASVRTAARRLRDAGVDSVA